MAGSKTLSFIKQFLKHPGQVGALTPSGKGLVNAMVKPIDFDKAREIVELGPGTGPVTRVLLKRMHPDARLNVVEINAEFCEQLREIGDKRLNVIHGDASKLSKLVPKADCVISGLPIVNFPKELTAAILDEIAKIAPMYIQFNYSTLAEKVLRKRFKKVTRKVVLLNVPPAVVYTVTV
ncbi:MAG: methyltransferase domain-containing protein [Planctomycetes bacterium]|nr:methyltransferase domain-containing protein [Planctomycetota bacterium]